jgi:hypothetical protein
MRYEVEVKYLPQERLSHSFHPPIEVYAPLTVYIVTYSGLEYSDGGVIVEGVFISEALATKYIATQEYLNSRYEITEWEVNTSQPLKSGTS